MSTTSNDPTDQRILDAAERLFAEHGVDGVSLRSVMAEAGTNVAAVRYHFGSKDDLLQALIAKHQQRIETRRLELLDTAEQLGTVRAIAEAIVLPICEIAESGGLTWVSVMSKLLASGDHALRHAMQSYHPQRDRIDALLHKLLPHAGIATLRFRVTEATALAYMVVGNAGQVNRLLTYTTSQLTPDEVNEHVRDTVTAILSGPPDRA